MANPSTSRSASPNRSAGLEVPVFAVPREGDLGAGDTQCVHQLLDLADELGLRSLTVLPIQETVKGNDPYAPISQFALEPMLLEVSPWTVEDLPDVAYEQALENGPKSSSLLSYARAKKTKLDLLWQAFEVFWKRHFLKGTNRAYDYHRFCDSQSHWLPDYCLYRLLMDLEQGSESWEDWGDSYGEYAEAKKFLAGLSEGKPDAVEHQLAYYAYAQWIAHEQWLEVREHADLLDIQLMMDVPCAISPHCAEFFRKPDSFRLEMGESRGSALSEHLIEDLEERLKRFTPFFNQFRIPDFHQAASQFESDDEVQSLKSRVPSASTESGSSSMPIKIAWESLPAIAMESSMLWPAPNGSIAPPAAGAQMSFTSFGANSLRRLWRSDVLFRRRLKNQWAVNRSRFDTQTTIALLKKLFQYPAGQVQISYLDLAGLENDPGVLWLARYEKGVDELRADPQWEVFRDEFRKALQQTERLAVAVEKTQVS